MASPQLISPPDQAPPGIGHLSPTDRVRLWAEIGDEGDQLIFEDFRRRHDGDEGAARRGMAGSPCCRVAGGEGNRDEIDWQRLHREIVRHGLGADYREIWREAFPAEPVPDIG